MSEFKEVSRKEVKEVYKLPCYETKIYKDDDGTYFFYFNTCIAAARYNGSLAISCGGWYTATTKKRINKILDYYNIPWSIYQKDYVWHLYNHSTKESLKFYGSCEFDCNAKELTRAA